MSPLFTIVTPSFNQGRFLDRTIRSVLDQFVSSIEYLVFDGGSTDDSIEILKSYEKKIKWVSEADHGQAHAVNKGFKIAQGEIIGWLNSDDIYYPGALERVAGIFQSDPTIDIVYGDAYHINENDQVIEKYYTEPWNFERLLEVCFICQPATFIHRRVFEKIGYLNESLHYCMDYDYWIRAGKAGLKFYYFPEILAGSRLYAETKTLGSRIKVHYEINDMLRTHLERVPDRWLFNYAHAIVDTHLSRDKRLRFALWVSLVSIKAALHWNKSITSNMISYIFRWLIGATRANIREWISI